MKGRRKGGREEGREGGRKGREGRHLCYFPNNYDDKSLIVNVTIEIAK